MKPARRLTLRSEALTELSGEQLEGFAGAYQLTPQCATTPLDICVPTVMPRVCVPTVPVIVCLVSFPC